MRHLYVAYHDEDVLNNCPVPDNATKLYLNTLPGDPALAEGRALLWLNNQHIPTGYIGLFQASYPVKFSALPAFADLPDPSNPYTVYGAVVGTRYLDQARGVHPGMDSALARIFAKTGIPLTQRPGPFCNSLIAHSDRWKEFLPKWRQCYDVAVADDEFLSYDTTRCKPEVVPAYLLERFTVAWFAHYTDVIRLPSQQSYHPVYV